MSAPAIPITPSGHDGLDVHQAERAVRDLLVALGQDPSSELLRDDARSRAEFLALAGNRS